MDHILMNVDVAICRDASAKLGFSDLEFDGAKEEDETISIARLRSLSESNGLMCPDTHVIGSFNSTKVPKRKVLSFNRIHNTVNKVRHNHHKEDLEHMLQVCNLALGQAPISELMTGLEH